MAHINLVNDLNPGHDKFSHFIYWSTEDFVASIYLNLNSPYCPFQLQLFPKLATLYCHFHLASFAIAGKNGDKVFFQSVCLIVTISTKNLKPTQNTHGSHLFSTSGPMDPKMVTEIFAFRVPHTSNSNKESKMIAKYPWGVICFRQGP